MGRGRKRSCRRAARRVRRLQPHERVIDIGCGTGLVSRSIGAGTSTLDHMAIDLSPDMITHARRQSGDERGIQYSVMDAHHLVFNDAMFDVAILGQSLAYLEDPWQAFAEIRRVLRPMGASPSPAAAGVCPRRRKRCSSNGSSVSRSPRTDAGASRAFRRAVGAHQHARDGGFHGHRRDPIACRCSRQ